jgi:hydroxymethylbilane synthase
MTNSETLRIGTRGSPLALYQANEVRDRLIAAHPALAAPDAVVIEIIRTTGDRVRDRALAEIGGKGLFTKEIEQALYDDRIDVAVHSMKDVPTWLPDGLVIDCMLPRADPRDALIANNAASVDDLPERAVVGSASVRRVAQLKRRRPDLEIVLLRGNVETRLGKLADGEVDATLLALAGLDRLGVTEESGAVALEPDEMLPAVAQGAIGIECRENDERARELLAAINDRACATRVACERALLAALDGSCRTPIAGLAELDDDDDLTLRGLIAKIDGSMIHETSRTGAAEDALAIGTDAGRELLAIAGPGFLDHLD